ncbi:MAG: hypothetical protein Q7T68_01395 [Sphingopyxis sp.]|nr:hypothetical protein [Sphingopyxis sp.]
MIGEIEPGIKASGKYELGNLVMTEETAVDPVLIERLAVEAHPLNFELGNPSTPI